MFGSRAESEEPGVPLVLGVAVLARASRRQAGAAYLRGVRETLEPFLACVSAS